MSLNAPLIRRFDEIAAEDLQAVGGKGLNLGLMWRAGFPVPGGFCLTSDAFREARPANGSEPGRLAPQLLRDLEAAYVQLGADLVAVRSSASAEDGAATSFAGQQETILGVAGAQPLADAVIRCWESWDSDRSRAYREKQQIATNGHGMAVVVQQLVPAEISGVLFTRDPLDSTGRQMLVEAAWGLGELVVSGRLTPDRFHVDRDTGVAGEQQIQSKPIRLTATGVEPVPAELQNAPSLNADQLQELTALGRQVEEFYGGPRDVEWAWGEGRLWLLQARPVTTAGAFEREQVRREEVAALTARSEPGGTIWARYNLSEVLPAPTPMTWDIVRRFMSGRGGYGLMFRDLGFDPDPALDDEGFIDLVCGRPYINLRREPKIYFRDFPYGYDFAVLKARPEAALYPQPGVNAAAATARLWLRLPSIVFRMFCAQAKMQREMKTCADKLRNEIFPQLVRDVEQARQQDLGRMSPAELLALLKHWRERTLNDFARWSLRSSICAAAALGNLEAGLKGKLSAEEAAATARSLLSGLHPDADADLPAALQALGRGRLSRDEFLKRFGHRGPSEMELAQPRWNEDPAGLPAVTEPVSGDPPASPPVRQWDALANELALPAKLRQSLVRELELARSYLGLRESSKHYLMLGYAQIRRVLLELAARFGVQDGIFYLTLDDLPRLIAGEKFDEVIAERRSRRRLALSLEAPPVIFSDDLECIGRQLVPESAAEFRGTAVSAGIVEGAALVLTSPIDAPAEGSGFILVCPSTDPAWVPLFLRAKGLVMETGGVLSHGAIVAREFGLPAVVGISQVHQRLQTGQRLRVDGNSGVIYLLESGNA